MSSRSLQEKRTKRAARRKAKPRYRAPQIEILRMTPEEGAAHFPDCPHCKALLAEQQDNAGALRDLQEQ